MRIPEDRPIYKAGDVVVGSTKYRTDLAHNRAFVVLVAYEADTRNPDASKWRQSLVLFPLSGPTSQGMARQKTIADAGKAYRQDWEVEAATGDLNLRQFSGPSAAGLQQRFRELQEEAQATADDPASTARTVFQGTIPVLDEPKIPKTRVLTGTAKVAQEIRDELKAAGIKPRDVSVRTDNYSMGSSIDVEVLSLDVPYSVVEKIANKHASVRYDEMSGEILSGGNRYVHVRVDDALIRAAAAKVKADQPLQYLGCTIAPVYDRGAHSGYYCDDLRVNRYHTHDTIESIVRAIYCEKSADRAAFHAKCEREEQEARNPQTGTARDAMLAEIERLKRENAALRGGAR